MKKPNAEPWKPTVVADVVRTRAAGMISHADIRAIRNVWQGKANEHEQRLALEAIIYSIARTNDMAYRPKSERDTNFALGMAHVGREVEKITDIGNIYLTED